MANLKKYLTDHNLEVSEVLEKVNYTESQIAHLKVIQYPDSLVKSISERLQKSESTVWFELLLLEDETAVSAINNLDDLVQAVDSRQPYIYIPDSIRREQQRLINSVLTEEDRLGFELGSMGTGNILAEIIYRLGMLLNKESGEFKQLKSKLRRYFVKTHDETGSLLYEKEQTF